LETSKDNIALKDFLVQEVLLSRTKEYSKEVSDKLLFLRRDKVSKPHIFIGKGTCGVIAGAVETLEAVKEYLDEHKIEAEVIAVGCIGMCSSEPIVDVQLPGKPRISFENITADKVTDLLDGVFHSFILEECVLGQYKSKLVEDWDRIPYLDDIPFLAGQKRIVLQNCGKIDPHSIEEYIAKGGYIPYAKALRSYTHDDVCGIIEKSRLRGRGGGGFPTGKKWTLANNTAADQKYLICNADESDPGAFMDRALIEGDPHRLIEGIAIGAYATAASKAYIYIRTDYALAVNRLELAIQKAKEYGILGQNIFDSGFSLEIIIKKGAGAFVCGEETALISSIEGKRGMPRPRPPYPEVVGLFGRPTAVNNVETLANVPAILENGPEWFASIGTTGSTGTKVFALSGKVKQIGLVEIPMGTSIREIIFQIGGGIPNNKTFKAVQIGGPTGGCVSEQNLDTPIDFESLKGIGAFMGSGGMVIMDETVCMIDVVKYFMGFIYRESCGKCIPCREGTQRMYEILKEISKRPSPEIGHDTLDRFKCVMQLQSLAEVIKDTSLCGLGQTAPNPVLSTLHWFREEYEEHVFDRKCRSNVCRELRTFFIEPDKCTGCAACAKKCPVNAITGTKMSPYSIVDETCNACGICLETCKFNAILVN
jgi:NADH:ubiquinone oxidoreductase subunit F (NADH-binding)/Pyruvate/2-oxoacid:ferredoxin oxidoreductase delta subunit